MVFKAIGLNLKTGRMSTISGRTAEVALSKFVTAHKRNPAYIFTGTEISNAGNRVKVAIRDIQNKYKM